MDPSSNVLNPGAVTRMNNNVKNAQRATMPLNAAAQASLRHQTKASSPQGAPLQQNSNGNDPVRALNPRQPVNLPTGGPVLPQEAAQGFDPEVFKEDVANQLLGAIRTQQFMNSPRVKDAQSSVQLREFFNHSNPKAAPDSRDMLQRVIARIGLNND